MVLASVILSSKPQVANVLTWFCAYPAKPCYYWIPRSKGWTLPSLPTLASIKKHKYSPGIFNIYREFATLSCRLTGLLAPYNTIYFRVLKIIIDCLTIHDIIIHDGYNNHFRSRSFGIIVPWVLEEEDSIYHGIVSLLVVDVCYPNRIHISSLPTWIQRTAHITISYPWILVALVAITGVCGEFMENFPEIPTTTETKKNAWFCKSQY